MAGDFFIKLDGIDGESYDEHHLKWIDVLAFSHGTTQHNTTGHTGEIAGRGELEPFRFTHLVDKASPKLMKACMTGQRFPQVKFAVCRNINGTQTPVYEILLEQVKITRCAVVSLPVSSLSEPQSASSGSGSGSSSPNLASISALRSASDLELVPIEEVELLAGKISWKVTPIKPDNTKEGAVEAFCTN